MREFVVGTGGAPPYPFVDVKPNSEVRLARNGVLGSRSRRAATTGRLSLSAASATQGRRRVIDTRRALTTCGATLATY